MIYFRPRRYYKNSKYEVWSMEHNYGEGFIADDRLILCSEEMKITAYLIVKDKARENADEYYSYVYALFDDLLDDAGERIVNRFGMSKDPRHAKPMPVEDFNELLTSSLPPS